MHVAELWRYPVKSLQGEPLTEAEIGVRGIIGDRRWGILDLNTGHMLTARREPALLMASARFHGDDQGNGNDGHGGSVELTLPDGTVAADDQALTDWLGHPVALREASLDESGSFEIALDFEDESGSEWISWRGPRGTFHDSARTQVSIVSTTTLAGWDRRRFRANVIIDGAGEDDLVGSTIALGRARLEVGKHIDRCVITTRPQPGGIDRDLDVLRTINRQRGGMLGVGAMVSTPGVVRVGDELQPAGRESISPLLP
jgi:uncharacterized protein